MMMARQQDRAVMPRNSVMLSAAKHLDAPRGRPFATLRVTRGGQGARPFAALRVTRDHCPAEEHCHAERNEASRCPLREAFAALRVTRGGIPCNDVRVLLACSRSSKNSIAQSSLRSR